MAVYSRLLLLQSGGEEKNQANVPLWQQECLSQLTQTDLSQRAESSDPLKANGAPLFVEQKTAEAPQV